MQAITASAPGKLMLLGEHAVVYDRPCLVTAVDLRVYVTVRPVETPHVVVHSSTDATEYTYALDAVRNGRGGYPRAIAFVMAALARVLRAHPYEYGLRIHTQGPPRSFGLGSSSAVTVAAVRALTAVLGVELSARALFDWAYGAVLDVQGAASGFDVAAAVYGGTLYFVTGGAAIEPVEATAMPLVIGYSGEKVSTVDLVGGVAELRTQMPWAVDPLFDVMADLVDAARPALAQQDWPTLGRLMNINQGLLDSLGVNTDSLDRLIFAARAAGALGAKLSGAGGGDCMFALADPAQTAAVHTALEQAGAEIVSLPINAAGVRVEPAGPPAANREG